MGVRSLRALCDNFEVCRNGISILLPWYSKPKSSLGSDISRHNVLSFVVLKTMASTTEIILNYVCPSLGCIMASIMFAGKKRDAWNRLRVVNNVVELLTSFVLRFLESTRPRFAQGFVQGKARTLKSVPVGNDDRKLLWMGCLWILYKRCFYCGGKSARSDSFDLVEFGGQ